MPGVGGDEEDPLLKCPSTLLPRTRHLDQLAALLLLVVAYRTQNDKGMVLGLEYRVVVVTSEVEVRRVPISPHEAIQVIVLGGKNDGANMLSVVRRERKKGRCRRRIGDALIAVEEGVIGRVDWH